MCETTQPAELTLPMDAQAAGLARRFLRRLHCPVHLPAVLDEAELLVTEVVTNSLRHGAPPLMLRVECDGDTGLVVRVSDGSTAAPLLQESGLDDESGRGVALIDMISDAWGVEPTARGKQVWFRLRAGRAAT